MASIGLLAFILDCCVSSPLFLLFFCLRNLYSLDICLSMTLFYLKDVKFILLIKNLKRLQNKEMLNSPYPQPPTHKTFNFGPVTIDSNFDSGNCCNVEKVSLTNVHFHHYL